MLGSNKQVLSLFGSSADDMCDNCLQSGFVRMQTHGKRCIIITNKLLWYHPRAPVIIKMPFYRHKQATLHDYFSQ